MFWNDFDTVLYQFLETGTSDRCLYMYRLKPEILRFHPIPPFIFPLCSPFKSSGRKKTTLVLICLDT